MCLYRENLSQAKQMLANIKKINEIMKGMMFDIFEALVSWSKHVIVLLMGIRM